MPLTGLEIWLDPARTSPTRIGGELRGHVQRATHCERATLSLVQHSSYAHDALGFPAWHQAVASIELAAHVEWPAGHTVCLPFEWSDGDFTPDYTGGLLSIAWTVDAVLQLAGDSEAAVSAPVSIALAPDEALAVRAPAVDRAAVDDVSNTGVRVAGASVVATLALTAAGYSAEAWWMWLGVAATAVALFALLGLWVQWSNERQVGNAQLAFDDDGPDDTNHCTVWTSTRTPALTVRVELVAEEIVYNRPRSQGDRKQYKNVVFRHSLELTAREPGCHVAPLPVLRDVPCSMENGMGSGVQWRATAVVTARGVHLQRDARLQVRPRRTSA